MQGDQAAEETTRGGGQMPQQEEGDKGHDTRQSGGGQHNKKRGTKDTKQGNWAMVVMGGGDAVEKKIKNQIEAKIAVVGTVGTDIGGGEARAKGKMSGWQTMQGNQVTEDATRGGGRQRKAIGWQRLQ
jgi:hypothetical protein